MGFLGGGGGGAGSGEIEYPQYLEDIHNYYMTREATLELTHSVTNLVYILQNLAQTPYDGTFTDPSTDLTVVQDRYTAIQTLLDDHNYQTVWEDIIEKAVDIIDQAIDPILDSAGLSFQSTVLPDVLILHDDMKSLWGSMRSQMQTDNLLDFQDYWTDVITRVDNRLTNTDITLDFTTPTARTEAQAVLDAIQHETTGVDAGFVPKTEYDALAQQAQTTREITSMLPQINWTTALTNAATYAESERAAFMADLISYGAPVEDYDPEDLIDPMVSKAKTQWATLSQVALDETTATTKTGAQLTEAITKGLAAANLAGIFDTAGFMDIVNIGAIETAAISGSDDEITAAVAAAVAAVNDAVIVTLISNYETNIAASRAKVVRRLAGTYADINAIQSSAFLFALALEEAQSQSDVNTFAAQVTQETYVRALEAHVNVYTSEFVQRIATDVNERALRGDLLKEAFTQHMSSYLANLSLQVNTDTVNKASEDKLIDTYINSGTRLHEVNANYEITQAQLHTAIFQALTQQGLDAEKANQAANMQFLQFSVQSMVQLHQVKASLEQAQMGLYGNSWDKVFAEQQDAKKINKTQKEQFFLNTLNAFQQFNSLLANMYQHFSTNFYMGVTNTVNDQKLALETMNKAARDNFVVEATRIMSAAEMTSIDRRFKTVPLLNQVKGTKLVATYEHEDANMQRAVQDDLWDLNVTMKGGAGIGWVSGSAGGYVPEKPSKVQSTLSGAIGGASVGAAAGPIGAGAGAVIGGLLGYFQ